MTNNTPTQRSYDAVIPADVRHDPRLKRHGDIKCFVSEIKSLCKREGHCWASNAFLANNFGVSSRTITRWISLLQECGYITAHYHFNGFKRVRNIYLGSDTKKCLTSRHECPHRVDTGVHTVRTRMSHNKDNRDKEKKEKDLCKEGPASRSVQKSVSIEETSRISERPAEGKNLAVVRDYCGKRKWAHTEAQQSRMAHLLDAGINTDLDSLSFMVRSAPDAMFDIALDFIEKETKRGVKIDNKAGFIRKTLQGAIIPEVGIIQKNMSSVRMYQGNDWPSLIVDKRYVKDTTFSGAEINLTLDPRAFSTALDGLYQRYRDHKHYSSK